MTTGIWSSEQQQWLVGRASQLGFDVAGIASVDSPDSPHETRDADRFQAWIEAGSAGEMNYLKRRDAAGRLLRSSVQIAQPWVRSAVVCAVNYNAPGPRSIDRAPSSAGWIARYAWSGQRSESAGNLQPTDYHDFLLSRLKQLAHDIDAATGGESRCYVDTGPVVERTLAARAGIGWIGKNTCLLNQQQGSWLLLGVVLTSLRLPPQLATLPAADRCGSCTRCIEACPTDALTAPHQMDASRCIAYLTIEKKGSIPVDLRESMGRQIFGCDICQDVCPWNRSAPESRTITARPELIDPELGWIAAMDGPTFKQWFKGSPLERTRRARLHRNTAIAMGNSGEVEHLPKLRLWAGGEDPVLAEAAQWAIEQIGRRSASPRASTGETQSAADPEAPGRAAALC